MKKILLLAGGLITVMGMQAASDSTSVRVSGNVRAGVATDYNTDHDIIDLIYETNDPRLGTNSHQHYFSEVDDVSRNVCATYGADVKVCWQQLHDLSLSIEGANAYERAMGTRTERLTDSWNDDPIRTIQGKYYHPRELSNELTAAVDYTYHLRRPGSALSLGYRYRWENEQGGVGQQLDTRFDTVPYKTNILEQRINYHTHHAHLDYTLPVAKGHLLDFGLHYDRRELTVHSEQEWDKVSVLDANYRHLMQYGAAHARYRLRLGPVEAMARLEYRATKMQSRWLHDVLPTATVRYQIDTVHALSAFYTIILIRPDVQHLDTTKIVDAFTTRFGKDEIVGVHVHNTALTYRTHLKRADLAAEVRYITAKDGFNAIWMERGGNRIYTWGNEGVRHAVGFTPSVESRLTATTGLHAAATLMWDERVAEAINLTNANWGIRADMRLTQQLPHDLTLVVRGDYGFHNTLDVYSYAGHGGSVGADLSLRKMLGGKDLGLKLSYTCLIKPDIHITQGAYVGIIGYQPGVTHQLSLHATYTF